MGTKITGARQTFYIEDTQYRAANSEALMSKLASGMQFINDNQMVILDFFATGPYDINTSFPFVCGDFEILEKNYEIVNVWVTNGTKGSSGTTQADIERAALNSSSWSTIFSTKPAFSSSSADGDLIDSAEMIAAAPTGVTRPVLSSANLNAGDKLRLKLHSVMTGGKDLRIKMHLKPR